MLTITAFAAIGFYFLDRTQRIAWLRQIDLIGAQDQIRTLLHNVLPPSIAERKLAGESPIADSFQQASLLFADVVGFTPLSSRFTSAQVVNMLNDLFERFDRVVARHGLEKIKTIGDCYMVAGGLPEPNPGASGAADAGGARHADGGHAGARARRQRAGAAHRHAYGTGDRRRDRPREIRLRRLGRHRQHGEPDGSAGRCQPDPRDRRGPQRACGLYVFEGPEIVDVKGKGPTRVWTLIAGRSSE